MVEAGVSAFKFSTFNTDLKRFPRIPPQDLYACFKEIGRFGLAAGVHNENDEMVRAAMANVEASGITDYRAHALSRPPVTETLAMAEVYELGAQSGCSTHVVHCSVGRGYDLCEAYRQQYGMNGIYLTPVNLYGPRDNFDLETSHVIPALIRKCWEAKQSRAAEVLAWGTGSATREFLYVEDAAEAMVLAAEKYAKPDLVNLGSGEEISIRHLLEQIRSLVGYEGAIRWDATKPDGQPRRCLDTSRALAEFGWRAKTTLRDGLRETIRWFESNAKLAMRA